MRNLVSVLSCFVFAGFVTPMLQAETTVTISKTHLCCRACVNAVGSALADAKGVKAECNQKESTIKLTADTDEVAQKAIDTLAKAGFYGTLDSDKFKFKAVEASKDKVGRLELVDVHNCCGACNTAIVKAVNAVTGVKANTAKAKQTSFVFEGEFVAADVIKALRDAGFHANVKK